ncbi:hypothetical protein O181_078090 [Austropuccinia psidii MF-1]|uniref:Uncharacterized protein n=1 Tax=Austropuccinia psidii MF-1 TaxID=1389203 RepID=A0A9Q3IGL8_9BASI|nr:hypothetical protein [Austropuccinia psidii MF-1]
MSSKLNSICDSDHSDSPPSVLYGAGVFDNLRELSEENMPPTEMWDIKKTYNAFKSFRVIEPPCINCWKKGVPCAESATAGSPGATSITLGKEVGLRPTMISQTIPEDYGEASRRVKDLGWKLLLMNLQLLMPPLATPICLTICTVMITQNNKPEPITFGLINLDISNTLQEEKNMANSKAFEVVIFFTISELASATPKKSKQQLKPSQAPSTKKKAHPSRRDISAPPPGPCPRRNPNHMIMSETPEGFKATKCPKDTFPPFGPVFGSEPKSGQKPQRAQKHLSKL